MATATATSDATVTPTLNKMSAIILLVSLFCGCPVPPRLREAGAGCISLGLCEAAAAPAIPRTRGRPNDPRPAVMPTGLAVGLEPPRAPGAAGTACPKDLRAGNTPATVGRDWFP